MRLPSTALNLGIKQCLSNGQWQEAIFSYLSITRSGIQLSDSSIFPAIIKASSQISFKQGQLIHACSIKRGYDAFISAENSILDLYMKWGNPNSALSVFNTMRNRDSVSWNILIHGYFNHSDLEFGLEVFLQARVFGFEPNVSTLVLVAQAYRVLGDSDGGEKYHCWVLKNGYLGVICVQNSLLGMYVEVGVDYARQLFDEMSERDVISWSSIIGAYVQNGEPSLALLTFKCMSVEPDGLTMVSALRACASFGDMNIGRSLHGSVICRGHDADVFVANTLIDMYAKCSDPLSSSRVFDDMVVKNIVSWNSILSGLTQNGMHQEALRLANSMFKKKDIETDEVTLVNLLQLCKHFCQPNQCKLIHARVIRLMYESNHLILSSLINTYSKSNLIEYAWSLFIRTEKRDTVSWATMIGGFAYCGMPDEALNVFRQISNVKERITRNSVVILNLIESCAIYSELKRSKWVHGIAIRGGFASEVYIGTAIVDMYSKCGAVKEAKNAFYQIHEKNIMSFSAMISAFGMNGQGQDALTMVNEMKQHGLKPNSITALAILAACSHAGLVSSGLSFFKEMVQDLGIEPNLEHYACVIDMLSRAGKLETAMELIEAMPANFKGTGLSIWGALLSGCLRFKRLDIGEEACARVLDLDPFDSSGYLLASSLHAAMGSWVDVGKIRRMVKERGVRVIAGYSLVSVEGRALKFLAGDKSKPHAIKSCYVIEELHKCMQLDENYDEVIE